MNNDFVRSYIKYKVKRLSEFASFFFVDYDMSHIMKWLNTYFETYVNTHFYHILATLDTAEEFGLKTIEKEMIGICEELLDDYQNFELAVSDADYKRNQQAIIDMISICLFICQLDKVRFTSRESINEEFSKFIDNFPEMKERLGNNASKLVAKIKENFSLENKVFNDERSYFAVDCSQELKKDELYFTRVKHTIKILESNYKKSMVERVFSDDRFTIDKIRTAFWKLPRELMRKFMNGEKIGKYVIDLDDKIFQRGNIDLFRMIDNPFLKRYIVLGVSFNSYAYHKDFLEYLGFGVACSQDLSHIGEVLDKLNSIDAEKFFDYILVSDYKEKDKDTILGYECSEEIELYITKED